MTFSYKTYSFPFQYPFTISKATKTAQLGICVQLTQRGITGLGEATEISYYHQPISEMINNLGQKRIFLEKFNFTDSERFWHYLYHLFPNQNFLINALDVAGWDLFGKVKKKPIRALVGLTNTTQTPLTNYTIGIDTLPNMLQKIHAHPWPIYKIKVGFEGDVALLQQIRKETDAIIRVDANGGWASAAEALHKIEALAKLNIELVEQPLPVNLNNDMELVFKNSALPIIADESFVTIDDLPFCTQNFHGINIKLAKCGGITPALQIIKAAKKNNVQIMLGCMNESTVGSAALTQLAGFARYFDDDGTLLQTAQLGTGVSFDAGNIVYNDGYGLGVSITQT